MNYLTFADRLIAEGVKFHPDTVIVNAQQVVNTISKEFPKPSFPYTPAFRQTFVEFKPPVEAGRLGYRVGVACQYEYVKENNWGAHSILALVFVKPDHVGVLGIYGAYHVVQEDGTRSESGNIHNLDNADTFPQVHMKIKDCAMPIIFFGDEWDDSIREAIMITVLHTFRYMNQPGQIIEVEHPCKVAKKIERRTGKAPSNYYRVLPTVTDIGPGAKHYKYARKGNPTGTHASPIEHMVSPHKRVVKDHPFIPDGVYDIPAHKRGSSEQGKARKIFRVVL